MEMKSKLSSARRATTPIGARTVLAVLAVVACLSLSPVYGRWEVPEHIEPASSPLEEPSDPENPRAPASLPDQAEVPIMMYHYVSELPPNADIYRVDLTVLPEDFEAQLQYLAEAGYHAITLTDLHLHLTQGYPLPDKPIVLTFDDGYRDAYEVVFPLLLEYGFTGTFFVLATPAHYEWDQYMTWAQMREMAETGMEIQSHGRDHVDLRDSSYDYLVYQILGIQEAIQHNVGRPPRFFCYPSGRYDSGVIDVLEAAGYWGAVTTEWGRTHTQDERFVMQRIRVRGNGTLEDYVAYLEN